MTGIYGAVFWLAVSLILFLIESSTVQMLCIWFAFGAVIAMLASLFGAPFVLQLLLFFMSSIVVLLIFRPILKTRLAPKKTATNADAVIGQSGVVIEEIDNALQTGRVSVSGLDWSARSRDGAVIGARTPVKINRIEGVKLIVEPLSAAEEE